MDNGMSAQPRDALLTQYLTFGFAGEEYAVHILAVREIIEYRPATVVPGMPTCIKGVLNLRGTIVPVVDLAIKFGLPETGITPRSCLLVMEADLDGDSTAIAVIAESVINVLELAPGDAADPRDFATRVSPNYLAGVVKADDRFVPILDIDKVLTLEELLNVGAAQRFTKRSA
jgi:purine-binding chemotaxis protein CheW